MVTKPVHNARRTEAVAATLRAVRRHQRLSVAEVAARMGIAKRTYEYFEAGNGSLSLERLEAFALATESDPLGLILAIQFENPDFAVRVAGNRAVSVFAVELREFHAKAGEGMAQMEVGMLFTRYQTLFRQLANDLERTKARAEAWRTKQAVRGGEPCEGGKGGTPADGDS